MGHLEDAEGEGRTMTLFPSWFFAGVIYGSLGLAVLGAGLLVWLLALDIRRKTLW